MVDYERLAIAVPADRTAAQVTGKGFEYEPDVKVLTADQDMPIPTKPLPRTLNQDLTGMRIGRFTVIGLARDIKARWVVRCDCGIYSLRLAKSIKNKDNIQDRCGLCRHLTYLKRAEHNLATGKYKDINNY